MTTKFWMRFVHSQDMGATSANACDPSTGLVAFAGDPYQLPDRQPPLALTSETYEAALKQAVLAWEGYEFRSPGLMGYVIVDGRNGALPSYWMRIVFGPELEVSGWRDSDDDWAFGLLARENTKGGHEHIGDRYHVHDRVAPICQFASNRDPLFASNRDPFGGAGLGLSA